MRACGRPPTELRFADDSKLQKLRSATSTAHHAIRLGNYAQLLFAKAAPTRRGPSAGAARGGGTHARRRQYVPARRLRGVARPVGRRHRAGRQAGAATASRPGHACVFGPVFARTRRPSPSRMSCEHRRSSPGVPLRLPVSERETDELRGDPTCPRRTRSAQASVPTSGWWRRCGPPGQRIPPP